MASSGSSTSDREIESILDEWPSEPTQVARDVIENYESPDQATPNRLFWFDNGPWKRTVMYRDGVPHKFPDNHMDYVEQVIDYQVPPEYYDDLGQFDGSVTIRRTRGELSAECHGEPANFLALNLVHDILSGEKSVEEARQTYTEIYARKESGDEPDYIQDFQFNLLEGDQRDPDEQTLTDEIDTEAEEYVQ